MGSQDITVQPRSGLLTALDVIIAPKAAFERIASAPTWAWAYLLIAVVSIAVSFLTLPAAMHAIAVSIPAQDAHVPAIASMTADKQQEMIAKQVSIGQTIAKFNWIIGPIFLLIIPLIQSLVLLVVNAAAKGKADFRRLWSLSINVGVVGFGVAYVITAIVVLVRGPEAFDSPAALQNAVPGLATLVPSGQALLAALLGPFTFVNLWAAALFVIGMKTIAKVGTGAGVAAVAVMLIGQALLSSIGPALQK